jgi:hypothetical protein
MSDKTITSVLLTILFSLFSVEIYATDGVIEINQACAVNGGCITGDSPGFPVEISTTASYVLTSNLDTRLVNGTPGGIVTNAQNVTIDLNGFTIFGKKECAWDAFNYVVICSGGSDGARGISDVLSGGFQTTVKNGSLRGWGIGVVAHKVENIFVEDSYVGIQADAVHNCSVLKSSEAGIHAVTVKDSYSRQNQQYGIFATNVFNSHVIENSDIGIQASGVVKNNFVRLNHGIGIKAVHAVVLGNESHQNDGDGIQCTSTCTIKDNRAGNNGGHGIACEGNCLINDNNAFYNSSQGINGKTNELNTSSGASGNVTDSMIGVIETGANLCNGSTSC